MSPWLSSAFSGHAWTQRPHRGIPKQARASTPTTGTHVVARALNSPRRVSETPTRATDGLRCTGRIERGNGGPHHPYGVGRTLAGTAPRPQDVERHHVDPQWGQPTCLSPHAQLRDGGALELRSDDNSRTGAG